MALTRPDFNTSTGDDTTGALRKLDNNDVDLDSRKLDKSGGTVTGNLTINGQVTVGGTLVTPSAKLILGAKGASGSIDFYPNTDTTVGKASLTPAGQLQLDDSLRAKGIVTRAGSGGAVGGNVYNVNWTNVASLYIDSAFIGNFNFATSDPRLKQAIVYLDSAADGDSDIQKILAMKPCTWRYADIGLWHDDGITRRSFLSPEMQDIDPMLAEGDRNATNEDGTPAPLNLGLEAILSTVVGALRREIVLRQSLQTRLAALEGR